MKLHVLILASLALVGVAPLAAAAHVCDPDTGYCVDTPSPGDVLQPFLDAAKQIAAGVVGIVQHPCDGPCVPPPPKAPTCWERNGEIECTEIAP